MIEKIMEYLVENKGEVMELTIEHINWTIIIILLAVLIGIPLGILATRKEKLAPVILAIGDFGMATPNVVLLFVVYALIFGIIPSLLIALVTYALLPIMQNTITGIENVDPSIKEAAKGMGMSDWQILKKIEFPLALPVIVAGIRTSTVITIGAVAIAAWIGAGGLGRPMVRGLFQPPHLPDAITAAIICALLVIVVEYILRGIEKRIVPREVSIRE